MLQTLINKKSLQKGENYMNAFKVEGNWYKGNLHIHTTNSDGPFTPRKTVNYYKKRGYQFLCITDHDKVTEVEGRREEKCLVLKGAEYGVSLEKGQAAHLVAITMKDDIIKTENTDKKEVFRQIKKQRAEIILAHPCGSDLALDALFALEDYIGLEVFNAFFYCRAREKAYSTTHWDELLKKGQKIWGFASDDGHGYGPQDTPKDMACCWIMVKASSLSADTILTAIKEGNFYSSHGPAILDFRIEGRGCYGKTSPVKKIFLISDKGRKGFDKKNSFFSQFESKLKGNEKYLRLECVDENDCIAYSNPIFMDNRK